MMKQYLEVKEKHKDSILFFRLGDFYEMFFDDAIIASKELEIALTGRDCGQKEKAPMCGVPFHSADSYIAKLIEKGYKVSICEQVEDPAKAVGLVKRDVVRVITPGTIIDTNVLDEKKNNYLCCIFLDEIGFGLAYTDISTGDFFTTEKRIENDNIIDSLFDELGKIMPTEIICNSFLYQNNILTSKIKQRFECMINAYHEWSFELDFAKESIKRQFSVINLDGLGLNNKEYSTIASGTLIEYLRETQKISFQHINKISQYSTSNFMILDLNTRRNLELTETIRGKTKKGSLLWVLDKTSTAMGGRLLKKWIEEPLIDKKDIESRLNIVEFFIDNLMLINDIRELLKQVYDIERLMSKVVFGTCNARDLVALKESIKAFPKVKKLLMSTNCKGLLEISHKLDGLEDIYDIINDSIVDDPPFSVREGGIIKKDYNIEIKSLKEASIQGKEWLSKLEEQERAKTGIKNLKIGFNKVFGYYIEVSKGNIKFVPDYFIRKQTLANSERYITPELKNMEDKILGAEDKMVALEYQVFVSIRDKIASEVKRVQETSRLIAKIDVLNSLALTALNNNYIKPKINTKGLISIRDGKHPVVEKVLEEGLFVPNDTLLDNDESRVLVITGPNMAGKSTYMRQVALIVLMMQIGSFVPAEEADICIVDRIFTRIGASDDLSQGQSTFMVEMSEVANILNNATKNSLLILDEIGRGTSTYDGLSIAWSVIEYISDVKKIGAKTLFATHYHELTELEDKLEGVINYKILVQEKGEDIIFLRKIKRGGADRSYGIEVARLAGVRGDVINRAYEILQELERRDKSESEIAASTNEKIERQTAIENNNSMQLDLFNIKKNKIIEKIKKVNIENLTPLDAINILYKLREEAKEI
ncbi:DNA mismatch repair protein MutS [Proteiniborus sp.]|uniref:DNA mismatch repair protein MutS n=1 Tax=Proteiniborus sp. TaxID=2079015 RepID=UPI0033232648